ncbi:MAG: hypothetical protein QOH60_4115 [Mycobacterium sp.]|jgi:hypothetical protein|nr:hypothetical protein [Mycobacterium sp.]
MTDIKAAVDTASWFTPFRMVSEDPLRYELCLGTEEVTFARIAAHLKERGWVEESDGIWTPPDDVAGQHRA